VWFHVDAAYGGFFQLTARGRERLTGIERADSITLDPHKSLFLPFGTGALLVRDATTSRGLRRGRGLPARPRRRPERAAGLQRARTGADARVARAAPVAAADPARHRRLRRGAGPVAGPGPVGDRRSSTADDTSRWCPAGPVDPHLPCRRGRCRAGCGTRRDQQRRARPALEHRDRGPGHPEAGRPLAPHHPATVERAVLLIRRVAARAVPAEPKRPGGPHAVPWAARCALTCGRDRWPVRAHRAIRG
jgi:hypothetical protein